MSVQAIERGGYQPAEDVGDTRGWFSRNRGPVIRHVVINFFMVIILAPLAWVLIMSVKSRPDSMRGDFWPRKFDFTHYGYVFDKIDTLPINLFNSIYVTSATVIPRSIAACRSTWSEPIPAVKASLRFLALAMRSAVR